MARKFLTHLDMSQNQVQNAVVQNLASAPTTPNPVVGQLYFNTTDSTLYWCKVGGVSPSWISAAGGSSAFPGFGSVAAETAAFGSASSDGAGGTVARNDHKHGNPTHDNASHSAITLASLSSPFGVATAETVFGTAKADGIGTTAARNDHGHGNPTHDNAAHSAITLASLSSPFGVATAVTTFAAAKTDGIGTTAARNDHTHGSPTHDNAAHAAITALPGGAAGGDLLGSNYPAPVIANLAVTDAKVAAANKDGTAGTPSMRTLGTGAAQAAAGNDSRFTDSRAPSGAASGDLTGTYPSPTIALLAVTAAKIANATITDTQVAALNKDGADATPGMRTLGLTGGKAMPGRYDLATIALTNATSNNISMNNNYLTGLPATPPPQADYAASKGYVDSVAQGLDAKQSVRTTTTGDVGGSFNATGGFGGVARLTNAGGFNNLDYGGVAVSDRILVKNQTTPAQNGIYTLGAAGTTMDRAGDMDSWAEVPSAFVFVEQGTVNADTGWVSTADQGGTLNTTAITWTQFSSAGSQIAGAGLTKTGNTIDFVPGDTSLTVAPDSVVVNTGVIASVASLAGYVPTTQTITAGTGITFGGGSSADLSATRQIALQPFTSATLGGVPASGGGTSKYMRADGTWATPPITRIAQAIDTSGSTSWNYTHNLGNSWVMVQVVRNSTPFDTVECDVERPSANQVTIRFSVAPAANEYTAVII